MVEALRPGGRRLRAHAPRPPGQVRRLRGHRRDALHPHRAARRRARHDDRDGAPAHAARPLQRRHRRGRRAGGQGDAHVRPARGGARRDRRAALDRGHRLDRRGRPGADRHERRDRRRASTPATRGSASAPASPSAGSPAPTCGRPTSASRPRSRRSTGPASRPPTSTSWSLRRARPTRYFPSIAATIADGLGAHSAPRRTTSRRPARAGSTRSCTPSRQIQSGLAQHVLVVGAETLSKVRRLGRPRARASCSATAPAPA